MRRFVILANVNGMRLDLPRVVQRSALGSCDCRYAGRHIPPRARPVYMLGRAQSARIPPGCKGPANRPNPSWLQGPRNAPSSPLLNPICVQNVKITPNAK